MIDLSVINLINHKLIINLSNSINWKSSKCKNSSTSFPSLYCCSPWPTPNKSVCNKNVQLSSKLVTKLAKTNLPPALFSALLEVKDACKTASQEASQPSIFCTAASTNASIFDLYFVYFIHFSFEYTCLNSMDSFDSFDLNWIYLPTFFHKKKTISKQKYWNLNSFWALMKKHKCIRQ